MKVFNYISLTVMVMVSILTWKSIAEASPSRDIASDPRVHLVNNLEEADLKLVTKIMEERGYKIMDREIFSKSAHTVMITKAHADEVDPASVEIHVLSKEESDTIPLEVFNKKVITDNLAQALQNLPKPNELPALGQNR
jgi:hypothetical protein